MIDLHIHSNKSDGTDSIDDIISYVIKNKIELFSITDHDRLLRKEKIHEIVEKVKKNNIKFINGIEVSSSFFYNNKKASIHLLCYGIKDYEKANNFINNISKKRLKRNIEMYNKVRDFLKKDKKRITINYNNLKNINRVHFAKELCEQGYAKTINSAFTNYLRPGKNLFVQKKNIEISDLILLLKKHFNKVIIAHFFVSCNSLYQDNFYNILDIFKNYGIDGFEVFYPYYKYDETINLLNYCKRNNLIYTAGSDYHGLNRKDVFLGHPSEYIEEYNVKEIYSFFSNLC